MTDAGMSDELLKRLDAAKSQDTIVALLVLCREAADRIRALAALNIELNNLSHTFQDRLVEAENKLAADRADADELKEQLGIGALWARQISEQPTSRVAAGIASAAARLCERWNLTLNPAPTKAPKT